MKLRKTCLTALLVTAVALVGASTAMATSTALCVANESGEDVCKDGNQLGPIHYESVSWIYILATNPTRTIACHSLFTGSSLGLFTSKPTIIDGNFSYSDCTPGCTVAEASGEAQLKLLKTTLTEGSMSGSLEVSVSCLFSVDCTYKLGTLVIGATSASLPTTTGQWLLSKGALATVGGMTCPMSTTLDMTMESLKDIYIKK